MTSTDGRLAATPSLEELKNIMECPVCFEILSPPIYVCATGHAICKSCKPKLKNCAMCKTNYTSTRNFALESMISAAKFYCDYRSAGCRTEGTEEELKKHHLDCRFRKLTCCFSSSVDPCNRDKMFIKDFYVHLKTVHKAIDIKSDPGKKTNSFTVSLSLPEGGLTCTWSPNVLKFDGKYFVARWSNSATFMNCGFYLIDHDSETGRYGVKITIRPSDRVSTSVIPSYEIGMAVPSIREAENIPVVYKVAIPLPFLEQLGTRTAIIPGKFELKWTPKYTLYKL